MATSNAKLDELTNFELFRHVPKKELNRVADLVGEPESIPVGHMLTEQGRLAEEAYLVIDGTADVIVGERTVAEIGPGESIGEMAVVDNWPRSAYVVARTPMKVYRIAAPTFLKLLDEVPTVGRALIQSLSARLRKLDVRPPGF
jgi:CRP/FNR family transcriptional regulator, cyclic AMP receptor protein